MHGVIQKVEIPACDRMYTAYQAEGSLWQWKTIPFGLTNGVPCFQRIMMMMMIFYLCLVTLLSTCNVEYYEA